MILLALLLAAGTGSIQQIKFPSGTSLRDVQPGLDTKSPFINVRAAPYFAVGDGVADDTAAVNSAVTAAGSITKVWLPCPGKYSTSNRGMLACTGSILDWDTAATPYLIAHRGDINVGAPENTLPGFDFSAGYGPTIALETDVQSTADGALVLMHDSTPDRTTGATGAIPVSNLMLDQLKALDASATYNPGGIFTGTRIPTFEEYLRRYGGKRLLIPEVKDELAATGTAMAQMVVKMGLQRSVVITCFSTPGLAAVQAVDSSIKTAYVGSAQITPAAALAAGVWAVFINRVSVDAAYVASIHAVGIKVLTWNNGISIRFLEKSANTDGVDGITADDASALPWVNNFTPRGTKTISVPYSIISAGWRAFATNVSWTTLVSGGYLTWTNLGTIADGNFSVFYLPSLRPSATLATTQTITTTLKAVAGPTSGVTTRWMGLRFCWNEDNSTDFATNAAGESSGYIFIYRLNGSAELSKVVNGVTTLLVSGAWNAYAAAAVIPLRVDITATQLTVTRTDTVQSVTVANNVFARTGFISAIGSGVVPGLGATTLTY